jgi:acyl phosphate:glycerol-3-phosphate acyltransferase
MDWVLRWAVVLIVAYMMGSIPVGYLAAKWIKGVDVRKVGSGRIGGSNVLRAAGVVPAVLTVLGDFLKGFGAVHVAKFILPGIPVAPALAGLLVVAGHDYSLFLGFDGGVGSMTTLGAALALTPIASLITLSIGAAMLAIFRYSSLASLSMAAALLLVCIGGALWGKLPAADIPFAVGTSFMAAWELRPNIQRLRQGTERKLGQFVKPGQADVNQH